MKRSFTLIELVISIGLFALLSSFLLFGYVSFAKTRTEKEKVLSWVNEEAQTYQKLSNIFSHILEDKETFYSQGNDLHFCFDNGVDKDPKFSSKVQGRLYVNQDKELCLDLYSQGLSRRNILLKDVDQCNFTFFHMPDRGQKVVDPKHVKPVNPNPGCNKEWLACYNKLPHSFIMEIAREGVRSEFPFQLQVNEIWICNS